MSGEFIKFHTILTLPYLHLSYLLLLSGGSPYQSRLGLVAENDAFSFFHRVLPAASVFLPYPQLPSLSQKTELSFVCPADCTTALSPAWFRYHVWTIPVRPSFFLGMHVVYVPFSFGCCFSFFEAQAWRLLLGFNKADLKNFLKWRINFRINVPYS